MQASSDRLIKREFRKSIPEKPDYSINLWSILKNCIGRDLSKIPMPVSALLDRQTHIMKDDTKLGAAKTYH